MDAECFGIGIFYEKTQTVEFRLFMDRGEKIKPWTTSMDNEKSIAAWCIQNRKEVLINDIDTEYNNYLDGEYDYYFGARPEAIIYCPLIVEDTVIGMVTVQSYKKYSYTIHNVNMIKALASYMGIAIRNAQRAKMLSDLSQLDGLTEIPNRRRFDEILEHEWIRALRDSNPISLLLIDIDNFKEYNDNYGHLYGDNVIKKVAKALIESIKRAIDFTGRYGGDEFVSVLPNTDKEGALIVAENMRKDIEKLKIQHKYSDSSQYITISIGIATILPSEAEKWDDLINKADKALYKAKKEGRNIVCTTD